MVFSKAIAFDEEKIGKVAIASESKPARSVLEAEFIEKLREGDAQAFDTFVLRYSSDIYGLLYRITSDPEEAKDLTQETFLRAFKSIGKFRGDSELKTWLFRIAINQSRNRFRWWKRRKKEKTVSLDAPIGDSSTPLSETFSNRLNDPEQNVLLKEKERYLYKSLTELPENYRNAVVLCDIQGLSYDEIAEVLEVNIGTVKSRISRGRIELRKKLKDF